MTEEQTVVNIEKLTEMSEKIYKLFEQWPPIDMLTVLRYIINQEDWVVHEERFDKLKNLIKQPENK